MTNALATSDQALDKPTCDFQQGFRSYLPLYNDYTGALLSLQHDIQRPYDSLREIDFARLAGVADTCATMAADFEEQLEDINTQVGTVNGWTGDAATAFRGHIQQVQTAAQHVDEDLEAIAGTTGEAVSAGRRVISDYVDAIGDIDFTGFDQPGDIRFMIDVERMLKPAGDVIRALLDWLGDLIGVALPLPGGHGGLLGAAEDFVMDTVGDAVDWILDTLGFTVDGFLEWIAGTVREYLDASFKARFEANLHLLHDAVAAATTGIQDAFQPAIAAANAVTQNPFAALPVSPHDKPARAAVTPPSDGTPPAALVSGGPQPGGTLVGIPSAATPPGGSPGGTLPAHATSGGSAGDGTAGGGAPGGAAPGGPPVVTTHDGPPPLAAGAGGAPGLPPVDPPTLQPEAPVPVSSHPGMADGHGVTHDLPPGAGWLADPSQLPQGWTVDPVTAELLPAGAPGGDGDPEVHSAEGRHVLTGDGDVHTLPATDRPAEGDNGDGPTSVSLHEGDVTGTLSTAGDPDGGIQVALTAGEGHRADYTIGIGEDGRPELLPAEDIGPPGTGVTQRAGVLTELVTPGPASAPTVIAAVGFAGTADPALASAGGIPGEVSGGIRGDVSGDVSGGVPEGVTGEVGGGDRGALAGAVVGDHCLASRDVGDGQAVVSGDISGGQAGAASGGVSGVGHGVVSGAIWGGPNPGSPGVGTGHGGPGAAQLASASDLGGAGPAGGAQLATVGDDPRAGQPGGGAAPMMPMTGAVSGGDDERRGNVWQPPAGDVPEADEASGQIGGVLGGDG